MAHPVSQDQNESPKAWQWLMSGWHALRDKAVSAMTYFTPAENQEETASQRWSVLATDISEHKKDIHVELEIPGMDRDDLAVEVHADRLLVSGSKRTSASRREGSMVVTERAYGSFQRIIPLPCEVQSEGTKAKYKDGVLSVTMPKDTSLQPRAIPIARG